MVKPVRLMLFGIVLALGTPAFAADHLDCVDGPVGEPEQVVLNRHRDARRGDDALSAALQISFQSRAQVCAYLHGWSPKATRLAFDHKWARLNWDRVLPPFNADDEERLKIALMPMRQRLIALMRPSADAVARGEEPPPPLREDDMFREFYTLLPTAKIRRNSHNEEMLSGWLYSEGYLAAIEDAFARA